MLCWSFELEVGIFDGTAFELIPAKYRGLFVENAGTALQEGGCSVIILDGFHAARKGGAFARVVGDDAFFVVGVPLGCQKFPVGNDGEPAVHRFPGALADALAVCGLACDGDVCRFLKRCGEYLGTARASLVDQENELPFFTGIARLGLLGIFPVDCLSFYGKVSRSSGRNDSFFDKQVCHGDAMRYMSTGVVPQVDEARFGRVLGGIEIGLEFSKGAVFLVGGI